MKRILLIKPSMISSVNPEVTQPLGLLYLASYLDKDTPCAISIYDMRVPNPKNIERVAEEFRPDIIGFSALTVESKEVVRLADYFRRTLKDSILVAGGPHATHYTEEFIRDSNIDFVVIGEGERTFSELMQRIHSGESTFNVQGVAYRKNGNIIINPSGPYIENLDEIPFPAWSKIDLESYTKVVPLSSIPKNEKYMALFTSRACPFGCIYCHHIFGKGFRGRSPDNVLDEIKTLKEDYGVTHFEVLDDVFNFDLQRAERICDLIISNRMNISLYFTNGLRSDRLPLSLLKKLKEAGTRKISLAVETASPRLQKLLKRNLNLEKVREAIKNSSELGILTNTLYMIGFPTENENEIMETIRFASTSNAHTAHFFIVNPFLGTEMAEMFKQKIEGMKVKYEDFSYVRSKHNLSEVSTTRLNQLQRFAYRKFYLNLSRLWKIVSVFQNKRDLLRKAIRTVKIKVFPM